jgi:hypothetical protein
LSMGKTNINPMSIQIRRSKVVKLSLPKLKDGMLRQKMLRAKDL